MVLLMVCGIVSQNDKFQYRNMYNDSVHIYIDSVSFYINSRYFTSIEYD